jgi:phosphatidate cytidylyltransferase
MKTRIVTGLLLAPLLAVLLFAPVRAVALILAVITVKAASELIAHHKRPVHKPAMFVGCAGALGVFPLVYFSAPPLLWLAALSLFLLTLFAFCVFGPGEFLFGDLCCVFFASAAVPLMFTSLIRIMQYDGRRFVALLPFIITITSDISALSVGRRFGKHKLLPKISPGKTVEGSAGGFVLCVLLTLLYGLCLRRFAGADVSFPLLALYACAGNILAQFGDLCFSAVKREANIKDFGKLFPGHGGMLDRFDSLLFVLPLTELFIKLLPMIR